MNDWFWQEKIRKNVCSKLCTSQEKPCLKNPSIWRGKSQHNYKINFYKMDVKEKEAQGTYEEKGSKRVNTAQLI